MGEDRYYKTLGEQKELLQRMSGEEEIPEPPIRLSISFFRKLAELEYNRKLDLSRYKKVTDQYFPIFEKILSKEESVYIEQCFRESLLWLMEQDPISFRQRYRFDFHLKRECKRKHLQSIGMDL